MANNKGLESRQPGRIKGIVLDLVMGVGEWPILMAVRQGLAQVLPLIITGAVALLLLHLPVDQLQTGLDALLGDGWRIVCRLIQQGSFGIASLAVLICISLAYAQQKDYQTIGSRVNPTITAAVCLASYFVLAAPLDGNINLEFFSLSGGFPIALCVAIDDFGMGHTSLRYLKEFPVDTIKNDRSLTQETANGVNEHIITSIVSLYEAIGVQIIVEGVETEEQLKRFIAHRCSLFQGYLFSKPLTGEDYIKYSCESGNEDIRNKLKNIDSSLLASRENK